MNPPLETERLALRPFTNDDAEAFHAIWGDPEVIWWGANESFQQSAATLARLVAAEAQLPAGLGWLAIRRRGEEQVLGDVLLQPGRVDPGVEIGWHLRREAWGQGYATEAARAVLARVLDEGVATRVFALVALQNERSLRVAEKLGMRAERDLEHAGLPHRLFALERREG